MLYLKSFTLTFYYKALNEQKWIYEIPLSVRNDSSHSVVLAEEGRRSRPSSASSPFEAARHSERR